MSYHNQVNFHTDTNSSSMYDFAASASVVTVGSALESQWGFTVLKVNGSLPW